MNRRKPIIYVSADDIASFTDRVGAATSEITKLNLELKSKEKNSKLSDPSLIDKLSDTTLVDKFSTVVGIASIFMPSPFLHVSLILAIGLTELIKKKEGQIPTRHESNFEPLDNDEKFSVKATQILNQLNLSQLQSLVEMIPFSSLPEEFEFPPGHPLPESIYRVHPLKTKNKRYIPLESFYSLLFDERESELIRLLTDLGAKKIVIQEVTNETNDQRANANIQLTGIGGGEGSLIRDGKQSGIKSRTIKLRGKNWTPNLNFEPEKYSWLPYEPKWEGLVHARIHGGTLSDSIELTSDISYAIGGNIKLTEGILQNLAEFGADMKAINSSQKKQIFEVEFSDSIEDVN